MIHERIGTRGIPFTQKNKEEYLKCGFMESLFLLTFLCRSENVFIYSSIEKVGNWKPRFDP